jgi:hypothetical protein
LSHKAKPAKLQPLFNFFETETIGTIPDAHHTVARLVQFHGGDIAPGNLALASADFGDGSLKIGIARDYMTGPANASRATIV